MVVSCCFNESFPTKLQCLDSSFGSVDCVFSASLKVTKSEAFKDLAELCLVWNRGLMRCQDQVAFQCFFNSANCTTAAARWFEDSRDTCRSVHLGHLAPLSWWIPTGIWFKGIWSNISLTHVPMISFNLALCCALLTQCLSWFSVAWHCLTDLVSLVVHGGALCCCPCLSRNLGKREKGPKNTEGTFW